MPALDIFGGSDGDGIDYCSSMSVDDVGDSSSQAFHKTIPHRSNISSHATRLCKIHPPLSPGDRILAVDGRSVTGLSQETAARLVAAAGHEVQLTVKHLGMYQVTGSMLEIIINSMVEDTGLCSKRYFSRSDQIARNLGLGHVAAAVSNSGHSNLRSSNKSTCISGDILGTDGKQTNLTSQCSQGLSDQPPKFYHTFSPARSTSPLVSQAEGAFGGKADGTFDHVVGANEGAEEYTYCHYDQAKPVAASSICPESLSSISLPREEARQPHSHSLIQSLDQSTGFVMQMQSVCQANLDSLHNNTDKPYLHDQTQQHYQPLNEQMPNACRPCPAHIPCSAKPSGLFSCRQKSALSASFLASDCPEQCYPFDTREQKEGETLPRKETLLGSSKSRPDTVEISQSRQLDQSAIHMVEQEENEENSSSTWAHPHSLVQPAHIPTSQPSTLNKRSKSVVELALLVSSFLN
ncbi:unnamed protein product [Protopolystoma xenopodis]|uniref:PDZ domain-containing protein n=1 Tax=Protopolystoma xenopodis TaxID=117903 RepID=A0A448WG08_9PLAT|nr:unnamed protein product [Protopolystoma xenopodis]